MTDYNNKKKMLTKLKQCADTTGEPIQTIYKKFKNEFKIETLINFKEDQWLQIHKLFNSYLFENYFLIFNDEK